MPPFIRQWQCQAFQHAQLLWSVNHPFYTVKQTNWIRYFFFCFTQIVDWTDKRRSKCFQNLTCNKHYKDCVSISLLLLKAIKVVKRLVVLNYVIFDWKSSTIACEDTSGYCDYYKDYCQSGSYEAFLRKECKKTCEFCEKVSTVDCSDRLQNCEKYMLYCGNKEYEASMKYYCPAKCGFCQGNGVYYIPLINREWGHHREISDRAIAKSVTSRLRSEIFLWWPGG